MNKKLRALLVASALLATDIYADPVSCSDTGIQLVYLNVNNTNGNYNQTLIGLVDDATVGYDSAYDAEKLFGNSSIGLFSLITGDADLTPYTIQGVPYVYDELDVPIGLRAGVTSTYTLGLESTANFPEDISIILEDTEHNVTVDLRTETYSFDVTVSGSPIDINERFVIHFTNPNTTQQISSETGWELISTYMDPTNDNIASVTSAITDELIVAKDEIGNIYWDEFFINTIGDIQVGKAYKIKTSEDVCFLLDGTPVVPENTTLTLTEGWSFMGYLRRTEGDISALLASISSEIQVVKDQAGNIYWPAFNINSIGNMEPGKGYQIKMYSEQSYTYPSNDASIPALRRAQPLANEFYKTPKGTQASMHMMLPSNAWTITPEIGDEIAVKTQDGTIVGSGVYNEANLAITIWENDASTVEKDGLEAGESFQIEWYRKQDGKTFQLYVDQWETGTDRFEENQLAVVKRIGISQGNEARLELLGASPNPATNTSHIRFITGTPSHVKLDVYNSLGVLVWSDSHSVESGEQSFEMNCAEFPTGTYFYQVQTENQSLNGKLSIH